MSSFLATFGKPRFLGIVQLTEEDRAAIAERRIFMARSHRGEELAELVGPLTEEQEARYREMRTIAEHGEGPVRGGDPVVTDLEFVRIPNDEDIAERDENEASNMETLRAAQELIEQNDLDVKLVDAEMLPGRKKLFFYFTAENRVDFRTLVKDLARHFRTRIELRQMGVRDEARIIKGMSSCGLPCCCSYWLNHLSPIGIRMVKEQNIALNPAKISGICGRLMCCMAFEHKTYRELWEGMPSPGSKIKTPNGNYIVIAMDLAREAVRCHKPSGGDILVPRELFKEFKEAVLAGEEWEVPEDAISEYDKRKKAGSDFLSFSDNFDLSQFASSQKDEPEDSDRADGHKRRRRGRRGAHRKDGEGAPRVQAQQQTNEKHDHHQRDEGRRQAAPHEQGERPDGARKHHRRRRKGGGQKPSEPRGDQQ